MGLGPSDEARPNCAKNEKGEGYLAEGFNADFINRFSDFPEYTLDRDISSSLHRLQDKLFELSSHQSHNPTHHHENDTGLPTG